MIELIKKYKKLPIPVKASVWFLACSFLQKGINVIITPILTRILTTDEYGKYSVFNSWFLIIGIFVSLKLAYDVYQQGLVKFENDRKVYSSSMQGLALALVVGWAIIYILFRSFWNSIFTLTTLQMAAMFVIIWCEGAFNFWAQEKRLEYSYRNLVILTVVASLLKPLMSILFAHNATDRVTAWILGIAAVDIVVSGCLFLIQIHRGKKLFSKRYWTYAVSFNIPLIPHYLSQSVLNSADRIMISSMVGSSEAGIYGLAYGISQIMIFFNQALLQTISPWIYKKIKASRVEDIGSVSYPAMCGIAIVNLALIVVAPEIVHFFAPKEYYNAIYIIPPVAMSVYFMFCYTLFSTFEFYYEKKKWVIYASIVGAVLNLVLNRIFISLFGYYAAGYTTLFCYILYSGMHYFFMKKICEQYNLGDCVFERRKIVAISSLFLLIGFMFMLSYKNCIIRYGIIIFFVAIIICKKDMIAEYIRSFLNLRRN